MNAMSHSTAAAAAGKPEANDWEARLGALLDELSAVQADLLSLLETKRQRIVAGDRDALASMQAEEQVLADRLAACQQRRQAMLDEAKADGLPSRDLRTLVESLPGDERGRLRPAVREARNRSRLLQHQSLANWVLVQRTLLHLSQMVEIIATGGQKAPTYEKNGPTAAGGTLVDQAV